MNLPHFYPVPRRVENLKRQLNCSGCHWVVLPAAAGRALKERVLAWAAERSKRFIRGLAVTAGKSGCGSALVVITLDSSLPPEGYCLVAGPEEFALSAGSDAGCFYGLQTLGQLLDAVPLNRVPAVEIADSPDLTERGYMLDVARDKIPTMDSLKKVIDNLAQLRYNRLQLYVEHTFAFAADEVVWKGYSPLTPAEIMELDEYCERRFIELVPNLNSFGHLERWLDHPEYRPLAENPDKFFFKEWNHWFRSVITPGPEAERFIARLYDEYLPNFTSGSLNIGCDETFELGHGRSKKICDKIGMPQLYFDFLSTLIRLAGERGRKVMMWGDMLGQHPEFFARLPESVTVLLWGYESTTPTVEECRALQKSGARFVLCPGTSAWNSFAGRTEVMLDNVAGAAAHAREFGAGGLLLTDWGDNGHLQYWPISWPGLTFAAGCAWNADADNRGLLARAIDAVFLPASGVGELLLELGRVSDAFPVRPQNESPLSYFFWNEELSGDNWVLKGCTAESLAECRRRLKACRRKLDANFALTPLVRRELANTACFLELALLRAGEYRGRKVSSLAWNNLLNSTLAEHRELWIARNRIGGLSKGSDLLSKLFRPESF